MTIYESLKEIQDLYGSKTSERFGATLSISPDGKTLLIGTDGDHVYVYRQLEHSSAYKRSHVIHDHASDVLARDDFYIVRAKRACISISVARRAF